MADLPLSKLFLRGATNTTAMDGPPAPEMGAGAGDRTPSTRVARAGSPRPTTARAHGSTSNMTTWSWPTPVVAPGPRRGRGAGAWQKRSLAFTSDVAALAVRANPVEGRQAGVGEASATLCAVGAAPWRQPTTVNFRMPEKPESWAQFVRRGYRQSAKLAQALDMAHSSREWVSPLTTRRRQGSLPRRDIAAVGLLDSSTTCCGTSATVTSCLCGRERGALANASPRVFKRRRERARRRSGGRAPRGRFHHPRQPPVMAPAPPQRRGLGAPASRWAVGGRVPERRPMRHRDPLRCEEQAATDLHQASDKARRLMVGPVSRLCPLVTIRQASAEMLRLGASETPMGRC